MSIAENEMPPLGDQVGPLPARHAIARGNPVRVMACSLAVLDQPRVLIAGARRRLLGDPENPVLREMRSPRRPAVSTALNGREGDPSGGNHRGGHCRSKQHAKSTTAHGYANTTGLPPGCHIHAQGPTAGSSYAWQVPLPRFPRRRTEKEPAVSVGDPRFEGWETVSVFEDQQTAVAWRDQLHAMGVDAACVADHPLDRLGRGDIYLVVPSDQWSRANEVVENLDD
jgi:hypothetical protein